LPSAIIVALRRTVLRDTSQFSEPHQVFAALTLPQQRAAAAPVDRRPRLKHARDMDVQRPVRATRTYTQRLVAEPARVFPLLCPVREADWIDGWGPIAVWSKSGLVEPDCVFLTRSEPHESIWYVTCHEPERNHVEMLKITPGVTACRLTIDLQPADHGSLATVTYMHTSLGPEGDALVAGFTEAHYAQFMQDWEARINHYLVHGRALPGTR
jgi:hypothetical protein